VKILNFLEDKLECRCYQSFKYSYDSHDFPINDFDDNIKISVKKSGENSKHKQSINLKPLAKQISSEPRSLFNYFLDGSRKAYKVDDIAVNDRMFPIIAGQIGVGCCERLSPDKFKSFHIENNLVLSLPDIVDKDSKNELFFNSLLKKLNEIEFLINHNLKFQKILSYDYSSLKDGENYENRGIAKIQDEMIEQEKKLVEYLVQNNKLNVNSYLLKDGSLEYSEKGLYDTKYRLSSIKSNYSHVVGVSKSFNPERCIDDKNKSNAVKIADLPLYHRTPAYMFESDIIREVKFSIWYLRIRDVKRSYNAFDGILKIEKILITDEQQEHGLDSDEIDMISANIINERNPVAYGSDKRWANHLYPVFLTESFVKSKYISDVYFLNLF
jgi:hypothetical protein